MKRLPVWALATGVMLVIIGVIVAVIAGITWVVDNAQRGAAYRASQPPTLSGLQSMCTEHGDRIYWRDGGWDALAVVGGGCR